MYIQTSSTFNDVIITVQSHVSELTKTKKN